jgi:hypothetical protein
MARNLKVGATASQPPGFAAGDPENENRAMRQSSFIVGGALLLVSMALSACASRPFTPDNEAWELVDGGLSMATMDESPSEVKSSVVAERPLQPKKAVWLNPYDASFYANTPTATAIAQRQAMLDERDEVVASNQPAKVADERNPVGWSHDVLVERWGIPARIEGTKWVYRATEGKCGEIDVSKNLEMRDGVVTQVQATRKPNGLRSTDC